MFAPITSSENPQFKAIKKLAGSARERRKTGLALLDGLHLIEAWLATGRSIEKVVFSVSGAERPDHAAWRMVNPLIRGIVLSDPLFAQIAAIDDSVTGFLAIVETLSDEASGCLNVDTVALDGVQDPGNLGSILRSAVAAGFSQAVLSPECAQVWSPKVLRAGMGAQFVLKIHEQTTLPDFLASYQGVIAVTHLAGAVSLYETPFDGPVAWVFGSEGKGVSSDVLAMATVRVRIPMVGQVESLNVGAAAAVCLFETMRRRESR